ncbi:MAG: ABC transporter ATP-binding protein [Phycisphaerales bacterium]|nr:MAG: ABC transporter ATP-binding protein [Phycisphaerales bacterium]
MEPAIAIESVTKRFGQKVAVDDLTLTVPPGELYAFLGPNGAGKTTTIKMICGLLRPQRGTIRVCGYPVGTDGLAAKARLAYVPDQPFLYDKLTAREFLFFVAEMYGLRPEQRDRRLDDLIQQLAIGAFIDQMTESFSHGMKQRVVLAAALLHDPQVLIVDEPMVGLDPRTVRTVKDLFVQRTREGRTVFMSTHTLEVAEAVSDRIGIIHNGRLITVGTMNELKRRATGSATLEEAFLRLTEEGDEPCP